MVRQVVVVTAAAAAEEVAMAEEEVAVAEEVVVVVVVEEVEGEVGVMKMMTTRDKGVAEAVDAALVEGVELQQQLIPVR